MNLLPEHLLAVTRSSERRTPSHHRGVALVITLILLAVITTLAIAFLGITHRETGAVDSMARTTDAEMAADSALERAKAEIAAVYPVRNQDVPKNGPRSMGPDMMVSVCCQDYDTNSASPNFRRTFPYDRLDAKLRLANRFDAAPPVFVDLNRPGQTGPRIPLDDRFFVDLNRNGLFEESGFVRDLEIGRFGTNEINWRVGDPQWIGQLQNPRRLHGPGNLYIGRYAFMVLPAGRSLNLNGIHNDAKIQTDPPSGFSGFFRNQGVGTYEMNMAGFLADLNSNAWNNPSSPYLYSTNVSTLSSGTSFNDAWELLSRRYGPKGALPSLDDMLGRSGAPLPPNGIDEYANSPLSPLGGFDDPLTENDNSSAGGWPGTANRTNYFSLHDLIGTATSNRLAGFQRRLWQASAANTSYDRYTFYRLLAQAGFEDSEDTDEGKINLNYVNIAGLRASDLVPWTDSSHPRVIATGRSGLELLFIGIVTNLLQREFPTYLETNSPSLSQPFRIPVFVEGSTFVRNTPVRLPYYSARVHQILQQAANIVDAIRGPSAAGEVYPYFPSVFRPQFLTIPAGTNFSVFVVNYRLMDAAPRESASDFLPTVHPWRDLEMGERANENDCVYGVPFIVGARRGLPNFSAFTMEAYAQAVRRLTFLKNPNSTTVRQVNEEVHIGLTNVFKLGVRNHYMTAYPRPLTLFFRNSVTNLVTNSFQAGLIPSTGVFSGFITNFPIGGMGSNYFFNPPLPGNVILTHNEVNDVSTRMGKTNLWALAVRNRLAFLLIDGDRIIDAVSMVGTNGSFDFGRELVNSGTAVGSTFAVKQVWNPTPNEVGARASIGVSNQFKISLDYSDTLSKDMDWQDFNPLIRSRRDAVVAFTNNLANPTQSVVTAPFVAVRRMRQQQSWEANDPLVHYTADDLWYKGNQGTVTKGQLTTPLTVNKNNGRWSPWGGRDITVAQPEELDITYRDQSISIPDDWHFPTHALPTIGWVGRIHRGTPWQTLYLKSERPGAASWKTHSGQVRSDDESERISPTNDWRLVDVLTTTVHPSAVRGRLSINQTNLAAWSAALSGVIGSTVIKDPTAEREFQARDLPISPASASADLEVERMVEAINAKRNARLNREFTKLSDILSVPELNAASPVIKNSQIAALGFSPERTIQPKAPVAIYDSDYERIYEQILSLLKVGEPRFVIYGWGQSLKPARLGVPVRGGRIDPSLPLEGPSIDPDTKTVNNYQVTGEVATKSVVRVVFPERESNNPTDPGYNRTDYRRPRLVVESFNIIPLE